MQLRAELVPQRLLQSLFCCSDSQSAHLWLTATACFAEVRQQSGGSEGFLRLARRDSRPMLAATWLDCS